MAAPTGPDPPPLREGTRLGAVVLQRVLHMGDTGIVYLGHGLPTFQDCLDWAPGESCKLRLRREIAARGVFWLFWSRRAAASAWVRWELDSALACKDDDEIVPMPLEDPALTPPPEPLAHQHFRDRFMIAGLGLARLAGDDHRA